MASTEMNVAYDGASAADYGARENAMIERLLFEQLCNDPQDAASSYGQAFTPINHNAYAPTGTVSPQDIFTQDPLSSVPPSTAFTDLTTPGSAVIDTPDDEYETSPLLDSGRVDAGTAPENWFSLFPDPTDNASRPDSEPMSRSASGNQVVVHPGGKSHKRAPTKTSPKSAALASSATDAGVHKREKHLPPIVVDQDDTVALKRARNTAAARKSRAKKICEKETLVARIAELELWQQRAMERHPDLAP